MDEVLAGFVLESVKFCAKLNMYSCDSCSLGNGGQAHTTPVHVHQRRPICERRAAYQHLWLFFDDLAKRFVPYVRLGKIPWSAIVVARAQIERPARFKTHPCGCDFDSWN